MKGISTKCSARIAIVFALGAGQLIVACKKAPQAAPGETASSPSRLEMPASGSGSASAIEAQAEVKASSGPIELSFRLYKTQIKAGESLWHQIQIRNLGNKEITIVDPVFQDLWELRRNIHAERGVLIEVRDPGGKPLGVAFNLDGRGNDFRNEVSGLLETETAEEKAMVGRWKEQGLTPEAIDRKLVDYNIEKKNRLERDGPRTVANLRPGESVKTGSWLLYTEWDRLRKRPQPFPIGDFAQLRFFDLAKPGVYSVRAVYNYAPTTWLMKIRGGVPIQPWEVLARTPWIKVTVTP